MSSDVFDMYGTETFADRDELFELQLDGLLDMLNQTTRDWYSA